MEIFFDRERELRGLIASIKGINIHGIFRYANTYSEAISIIRRYPQTEL